MNKKKKVDVIGRIPSKAWLVLSLLAAIILWTWLSHNEVTSRAFPPLLEVFGSYKKMAVDRGVVFQQYALFPWLTVKKNVMFGLNLKKGMTDAEREETAMKYIRMVGLEKFTDSYPKELSGGMKQRVAIARAYAVNPSLLLMDEPFGALDAQTRTQLQTELLKTWEEEKKTCFFITHDVEEAILLASRVVVMSARPGRIKEVIDIDIPYPRNQETKMLPRFTELKNYIWNMVYKEYLEVQK